MFQPLWFLRHDDRIIGPFPAPQIREFLKEGEITPDWEISLDEVDWLSIRDSGQFEEDRAAWLKSGEHGRLLWQEEREQARHRWLNDLGESGDLAQAEPHDTALEQQSRRALEQDERHTDPLLQQEHARRPPVLSGLVAILLVVGIAYFVWWGQKGESGMQTEIGLVAHCAHPLREAVN